VLVLVVRRFVGEMERIKFGRVFKVEKETKHEYEHYVNLTAQILKRPYYSVHKLVEKWDISKIRDRYEQCIKHNGDMPSDVYWWWRRKQDNENNHTPH
jgi:hypothetical protein